MRRISFVIAGTSPLIPSTMARAIAAINHHGATPPREHLLWIGQSGRDITIPSSVFIDWLRRAARAMPKRGTISRTTIGNKVKIVGTEIRVLDPAARPVTTYELRDIGTIASTGQVIQLPVVQSWRMRAELEIDECVDEEDVCRALYHLGEHFGIGELRRSANHGRFEILRWDEHISPRQTIDERHRHEASTRLMGDVNYQMGIGLDRLNLFLAMRNRD